MEGRGEVGGTCVYSAGKICFYEINSKMEDTTCGGVIPCISLICIFRSNNTCDIEHGSANSQQFEKRCRYTWLIKPCYGVIVLI